MPFASEKQARLMRAVAHGWKKPGCSCADAAKCSCGPTKKVAQKFMGEDMKRQRKMSDLLKN